MLWESSYFWLKNTHSPLNDKLILINMTLGSNEMNETPVCEVIMSNGISICINEISSVSES